MQPQTLKQEVLTSLQHLADDVDIDEIMYQLYVIDKLRKSRDAIGHGQIISHDDLACEIGCSPVPSSNSQFEKIIQF